MITTSSTSSTSSINATSTSSKRLSGLVSGLDTDTLVQQMSSGTQNKIDKQMQSKQIALWKQQSYRAVTTALTDFKTKYFSTSSSSSNISNPSFFNSTTINNTSKFLNVSGSTSVAKSMVVTEISQLAKQASLSSNHKVSNEAITTGIISSTYAKSKVSNATMTITSGGKDYAVSLSSDFTFNSTVAADNIAALAEELNSQISKIDGLKDAVNFGTNGQMTVTGSTAVTIKDGTANLLTGLGLATATNYDPVTTVGSPVATSLFTTANLADTLDSSTLTFSLNGVSKNFTFKTTETALYSDAKLLQSYLQDNLNAAFGSGKITVGESSGVLSFKASDPTSIVSIDSSDKSGVLGIDGALRTYAGETNRINTNKTLDDIKDSLNGTLDLDSYADPLKTTGDPDAYGLTINGKKFTFKSTDTIASIITTINNSSDANVTMSYSSINDSFSVAAKDGGLSSKVDIGTGSLANALFGGSGTDYTVQDGTDAKLKVSFDGNPTNAIDIVRSDNKFTLDGVNFELLAKTDTTDAPITFSVDNKTDDLYTKIKGFVDDYNALIDLTNGKVSESKSTDATYLPLTDAQKKDMSETQITAWETNAKKGLLKGDSILSSLSLNLRHSMTDKIASMQSALYTIGIATKANDYSANGKLTVDETALKNALTNDPDKVAALFTGTDGISTRMQAVIDSNIKTTGGDGILIATAGLENSTSVDDSAITKSLSTYDTKIKELQTTLKTQQDQYYAKFTKLEQYISKMNSQASFFTMSSSS